MDFRTVLAAGFVAALSSSAVAQQQPISIQDIRMQLFLEKSGKLSDNIAGSGKSFHNTVIGEGDAGEPADAILITLSFQGPKNGRGSDKVARDMAQVKVTQQAKTGQKILVNRAYGGFLFSDTGMAHKAFLVDAATCAPIEVEAKVGRSRKVVKVDFRCGE